MADCPRILAVLTATLLAAAGVCRGQEGARFEPALSLQERIVAPSPQVAEMIRYEDAALNNCDGTATMSVPLFQWQAGDIDMSLSLNYRIGAFKTDELGSWLEFVYLADGTKLSMTRSTDIIEKPLPDIVPVDTVMVDPLRAGSLSVSFYTTHYVGSYETDGTKFNRLNLPGGYVSVADTVYHWYLSDYQGNISGVVNTATNELEQFQDYYPYGKPHDTAVVGSDNRRKFGGKELITDKGYDAYDFEARPLTLTIPRFTQPDIMAEKFYPISIYSYCAGDPINLIDPTGKIFEDVRLKRELMDQLNKRIESLYKDNANLLKGDRQDEKTMQKVNENLMMIELLKISLRDIEILDEDEHVYRTSQITGGRHKVFKGGEGDIVIQCSNMATIIHEIRHIVQCLMAGGLDFTDDDNLTSASKMPGIKNKTKLDKYKTYAETEIEAYKHQYAFDPMSMPVPINSLSNIDLKYVAEITDEYGQAVYKKILTLYEWENLNK